MYLSSDLFGSTFHGLEKSNFWCKSSCPRYGSKATRQESVGRLFELIVKALGNLPVSAKCWSNAVAKVSMLSCAILRRSVLSSSVVGCRLSIALIDKVGCLSGLAGDGSVCGIGLDAILPGAELPDTELPDTGGCCCLLFGSSAACEAFVGSLLASSACAVSDESGGRRRWAARIIISSWLGPPHPDKPAQANTIANKADSEL